MRTTLTLEDDVAALLERVRKTRDMTLKDAVNEAMRRGLRQMSPAPGRAEPYRTRSASLGRSLIGSLDDVSEALSLAEGEDYR